jgi:hypothetical protein
MELANIEAGVRDSDGAAHQPEKSRRPMSNPQTATPTLHELVENPTRSTALAPRDLAQLAAAVVFGLLAGDRGTEPHPAAVVEPDEMLSVEQAAAIIHQEPRWFYRRRLPSNIA